VAREPAFADIALQRSLTLANPDLGTKQICPTCQAKFYDLNKRPAHCPKCDSEFDPDEAVRNRRVRARSSVPEADADDERPSQVRGGGEGEDDEEEEEAVTPELDEVADEPVAGEDEDDDAGEAGGSPASDDVPFLEEDEEVEDGDDVPFLEEDDDDFDDTEIDGLPDADDDR
jgi:uncharacterized protein (TIGR02300 family)